MWTVGTHGRRGEGKGTRRSKVHNDLACKMTSVQRDAFVRQRVWAPSVAFFVPFARSCKVTNQIVPEKIIRRE